MIRFPPGPEDAASIHGRESAAPSYEDITQDGRLRLEGVWAPTGRLLWSRDNPSAECLGHVHRAGLSTVLTRVILEVSDARLAPRRRVEHEIRARFEHTADVSERTTGIQFNTWLTTTHAERGSSQAASWVARAYGQRELVRMDAPPGQRRLSSLEMNGEDWVPPHRAPVRQLNDLLALPEDAVAIDPMPRLAPRAVVFGLCHTDSNRHVNFLTYPRFVEQLALERFVEVGVGAEVLARSAELVYRKPGFAGECVSLVLQAFSLGDAVGVVAAFVDVDAGAPQRESWTAFGTPRCSARLLFAR